MKQLQFTAPAFSPVFASLSDETVQSLPMKVRDEERSWVVELDDEGKALNATATAVDVKAC